MPSPNPSVLLYVHDIRPAEATGIGHYCRYLTREICAATAATHGLAYGVGTSPKRFGDSSNPPGVLTAGSGLPRSAVHFTWTAFGWPSADGHLRHPDLIHVLSPYTPVPTRARLVYTLHDLWPMTSPHWYSRQERWTFRKAVAQARDRADLIIVNSEVTARQVSATLDIPKDRLRVVHMAIDDRFFAPIDRASTARVGQKFGIGAGPYLVVVGTITTRKNLQPVIEAMAQLARESEPVALVAAGPPGLGSDDTIQLVRRLGLEDSVRFTGYIDHEDLAPLIAGAAGLVHPAADEGFGMTPLEGMACGIPTAVSNAGALPEVVGDAALLIDPHDSTQWADAIARLLGDDGLRADLIERGRARAQLFTWPRAALETIAVHREVLHV